MRTRLVTRMIAILVLLYSAASMAQADLYLRCDCNWWQADERYRLQETSRAGILSTSMALDAVGLPISFKLVDAEFSRGSNYGYLTPGDRHIKLGRIAKARATAVREYFEFMPKEDGVYQFYLDLTGTTPLVFVLQQ